MQRTRHILPGDQWEGSAYDAMGNEIRHTNFDLVIITNAFNELDRLTNRSSINGFHESFGYSLTGQRTNMIDGSGSTSYEHDVRDRLKKKTVSWTGGPTISLNYGMDVNGNVTNIWSSTTNGVNLGYELDALNRLTNVLANGASAAGYQLDPLGSVVGIKYGNGVTNRWAAGVISPGCSSEIESIET